MHSLEPRIHLLAGTVIDQIAAGEVVERPASVVKELVENSLDAGAGRIVIEIEAGGTRRIRVDDDGGGLSREELPLALERHCTSKLREAEELAGIRSLGFRGEALPAIAAVARLRLSSRLAGEEAGWELEAGGQPRPCARPPGTSVIVEELFQRVPARRKFLRSERTELHHIQQYVHRLALARLDVALELRHEGRVLLRVEAAADHEGRLRRLRRVCGARFVATAREVCAESDGIRVEGWIAPPEAARNQSDLQHCAVNARSIRDPLLARAVRRAYGEALPAGGHPAYALGVELAPERFDVNVHPAKTEVRFHEPRLVHDFLLAAIRRALGAPEAAPPGPPHPVSRRGGTAAGPVRDAGGAWDVYAAAQVPPRSPPEAPRVALLARIGDAYALVDAAGRPALAALAEVVEQALARAGEQAAPARRPLLVPERLEIGEDTAGRLAGLGFELDRRGPAEWVLRAVPAALGSCDGVRLRAGLAAAAGAGEGLIEAIAGALEDGALERLLGTALAAAPEPAAAPAWLLPIDEAVAARLLERERPRAGRQ